MTAAFSPWEPDVWSLAVYAGLVAGLVGVLLLASSWLGKIEPNANKALPYECGIIPSGSARFRYPVPFFLMGAFFLIFDVETAYIVSWATAWDSLGLRGFWLMAVFIAVLLLGLAYAWKKGGLDWTEDEAP
jgi:NADH-quinone oxidoreductase subunit A